MSRAKLPALLPGIVLGLALMSVAGCGFQPRGESIAAGNLGNVYVEGGGLLGEELRLFLSDSGVAGSETAAAADVVVRLAGERFDRRVLSVDSQTGKAREYVIIYNVTYSALARSGRTLVDNQRLTLERDYVFDRDAVIGKSREEAELYEEMRRDAALQILGRLDRALGG